ncbi:hypothetical protein ACNAW0_02335 [Micromonospora sp. SL1-18]|uniref:hypothetical protein n=1 Tax=Micromonospora sp. SL1-18 TaxID=3399128 RepID=UPI003A4D3F35
MTAPAHPVRLPSLTGLRWIAALLVFGFHVGTMRIVVDADYQVVANRAFALGLSGVEEPPVIAFLARTVYCRPSWAVSIGSAGSLRGSVVR